jgi:hypothetical protein
MLAIVVDFRNWWRRHQHQTRMKRQIDSSTFIGNPVYRRGRTRLAKAEERGVCVQLAVRNCTETIPASSEIAASKSPVFVSCMKRFLAHHLKDDPIYFLVLREEYPDKGADCRGCE